MKVAGKIGKQLVINRKVYGGPNALHGNEKIEQRNKKTKNTKIEVLNTEYRIF